MSEHQKNFPEFYVTSAQPCPYLPDRNERKLFTHLTRDKPPALIDNLLKGGFRRSQNIAYTPYCDGCQACVSVRVLVDEFRPSKNMKRVVAANRDLEATRHPSRPSSEQYSLFRDYIDVRHGDGGMADMSVLDYAQMVEDTVVNSFVTELRPRQPLRVTGQVAGQAGAQEGHGSAGRLCGVALCDRLSDGISMVYSFYDVDQAERSLGSYIILEHIEFARSLGLPYVYLGYWIRGSRKMDYKTRFGPQEHLTANGWERVE